MVLGINPKRNYIFQTQLSMRFVFKGFAINWNKKNELLTTYFPLVYKNRIYILQ